MQNIKIFSLVIITIIVFITGLFYLSSCKDGPTEPSIEPGRRDYVWEEDTLNVPLHQYIIYRDMVGNSPDDIWLGGLSRGLWHYNGKKWEISEFPDINPSALWLFEDNTLWVGTEQKLILKREQGTWTENYTLAYNDYDIISLFGMYGKGKNDIYAVGIAIKISDPVGNSKNIGIVLHYDGVEWKFLDIPDLDEVGLHKIQYQENIDTYFIWGMKIENGVVLDKLFTFDGENLTEILSTSGSISLSKLNGLVYIKYNYDVYKFSNNELVLWKGFEGTGFLSSFVGRSESDFFNNSSEGIGHYNGIDYVTIYPTHLDTYSKIIFEKEIFIAAKDSDDKNYIIIHGILKEENKE